MIAQKSTKSSLPTIAGSVDAYYRYSFNTTKSGATNNYTSFTNSQNSFELRMASIRADHSFSKASATVDLGFGRRAEEFRMQILIIQHSLQSSRRMLVMPLPIQHRF